MSPTTTKPRTEDETTMPPANEPTMPTPATVLGYVTMTEEQLRAHGDDLPAEDTLRAQLADPPRNRWGAYPPPVPVLPLPLCRALWRWDRVADLATDAARRAETLAADSAREDDARRSDLAASIDGDRATAVADLARDRAALGAAAVELATMAEGVSERCRTSVYYLDGSSGDAIGLGDWTRQLVGRDVSAYLATLDRAARQRAAIMDRIREVQGWWISAARANGRPLPEHPTFAAAQLAAVQLDPVRNLVAVGVDIAQFAAAERAALAPLAVQ